MNEQMKKRRDELMIDKVANRPEYREGIINSKTTFKWGFNACAEEYLKLLNQIDDECNPMGLEKDYIKLSHKGFDKLQRALGHIK